MFIIKEEAKVQSTLCNTICNQNISKSKYIYIKCKIQTIHLNKNAGYLWKMHTKHINKTAGL